MTPSDRRGIPISPEDPEALARALERVLTGRLRPDTAAARVWPRQFDTERVAAVYEQTYNDLSQAPPELAS